MADCPICKEFFIHQPHRCQPFFDVRNPETAGEDEWCRYRAFDAEEAAEKWAAEEDSNSADYLIVGQRSQPTVEVRDAEGNVTRWKLSGEAVATYYARAAIDSGAVKR